MKITLTYIGRDSWDRPVYKYGEALCVDINPLSTVPPAIHTKYNNEFDGEPDMPIRSDAEIEFVPHRDTWR